MIRGDKTHMTTASVIGTTVYMPEEAFGHEISPAWDCYSFGVVSVTLLLTNISGICLRVAIKVFLI